MGPTPDPDITLDNQIKDLVELFDKTKILDTIDDPSIQDSTQVISFCDKFTSIKDQEKTKSCSTHAATAIIEYFEKAVYNIDRDYSRLFLYYVSRKYASELQEEEVSLRNTIASLRLFGVPPEKYMPWDKNKIDIVPSAFCYSLAKEYQSLRYLKLDPPYNDPNWGEKTLRRVKRMLEYGFPVMFTFALYDSYDIADTHGGVIEPHDQNESFYGHHSVVACGYDPNKNALIFRNSEGPEWGNNGYGYLPYDYIIDKVAANFWVILSREWINEDNFGPGDYLRSY